MSLIVGGGLERPDVGAKGGLAVGGVLLSEEGCVVGGVVGCRGFDTCVDGGGDCGELGADCGHIGCDRRGAGYGTESTEVDAATIRAGGWCFAVSREHHLLVACVRRLLVDLVESTRDSLKHWGIRCFCHCCKDLNCLTLVFLMLLEVVEAEGEDLKDYLKKDFRPVLLFFVLHKSKIINNFEAGFLVCSLLCEETSGDSLFVSTREENTSFGVFGAAASVEANA